ncbi:hypothetical protein [Halalkalibacter akibai]|uniref:Yip1 domain-containing protein n=1 Tax=Halalkalibacter akibai (strain ATCC 43226 / DSM 21942 / CIP 109018 / JCM 9157 / 1139) TaxID=1236973 RepID=W4QQQ5_HALA3|nr:hypothetical protein [Halalkalibacter akibai]GAE33689.1 hypothetical protein JCM9157_710 [Halalkalibacter akibai JCM 9157]
MKYQFELIRSLKDPETKFYQLNIAEVVPFPIKHVAILISIGMVISIIRSFHGLDTAVFSQQLTFYSVSELELIKLLVGIGSILEALFSPIIYLLFASFCFSIFLDDVSFRQSFIVSTVSLFIFILGDIALLPFELWLGIDAITSPFALGVIASSLTSNTYVSHLFSGVSVFYIWALIIQVYAFSKLAFNKVRFIILLALTIHLVFLFFSVLKTYLAIYLVL